MKTSRTTSNQTGAPAAYRHLRVSLLQDSYGTPAHQKENLVNEILSMFQDPSRWPMTQLEQIERLKHFYGMAERIRQTEAAVAAAEK